MVRMVRSDCPSVSGCLAEDIFRSVPSNSISLSQKCAVNFESLSDTILNGIPCWEIFGPRILGLSVLLWPRLL